MEIGDSQNGNGNGKGKADTYQHWTMDDSNLLLGLLAEAMKNGLCDTNGSLSKLNVENFILPRLNAKTRFPKTYSNYLSRMKWFKNQYNKINELIRNNSGFSWDPIGKKGTASDEVWEEYLKSHPSHKNLRTECSVDYDDLIMFNKEKTGQRKRSRSEYEGSSSSNRTNNDARVPGNLSLRIDSISTNFERIYNLMEKRERDREIEKRTTIWDALKDIPDLDDTTRFRTIELLNTKTKNDIFFKMTLEERSAWILFNLKLTA
ncbi:hypothetical protein Dsin_019359 [Dipteronia sinensis]|uniref:Myb/SANT-like domain-containing protein n=1 Tax=Dipteronia sinensis TaxID=43782 RepID=A0AAE0A8G9_9ROSI|nr:hypothetical protein Dsin_019359 [Dipteronia sinensis]